MSSIIYKKKKKKKPKRKRKMENPHNRIDVSLVRNKKDYSKPSYMLHKIFDSDLVVIRKSKNALMVKKPAYIEMWIFNLSKVLMY